MAGCGGCCGCCSTNDEDERKKFTKDSITEFPVQERRCTDILCVPVFAFAQFIFILVTIVGMSDGDPGKLYKPRDYQGAFCGFSENWNSGPNTEEQVWLSYTMNVSSTVDEIMKQMVCSSYAKEALVDGSSPLITDVKDQRKYLCDCCLSPCGKCSGSLDVDDVSTSSAISSVIGGKMGELTDFSSVSIFSTSGANGGTFSTTDFWSQATSYFNSVCLTDCTVSYATLSNSSARTYVYSPAMDDDFYDVWQLILNAPDSNSAVKPLKDTINSAFTFSAYPSSICPYDAQYCVPFPGLLFEELAAYRCTFEMAAEVIEAVGSSAASAFATVGLDSMTSASASTFGQWFGDFQECLDSFFVVSLLAFVVGLIFLVVLRFTVGICVWTAVFSTVFFFAFGGAFAFVLSSQCSGASLFDSGKATAVAVASAGAAAYSDAVNGDDGVSEALTGDGADYRGKQTYTNSGMKCVAWDTQEVFPEYKSENYPESNLTSNYCRNPYLSTDDEYSKASTIWCITSDAGTPWEECTPIGVITPECSQGYAISSESARDALWYSSFVIWGLGLIWMVAIFCAASRIRLAIALNKVAAMFVAAHPQVVLIPIAQAVVAVLWTLSWFYAASFLLSQVPDDYVSTEAYATYAEAAGTGSSCAFWESGDDCDGVAGACTDTWPNGFVWKDNDCDTSGDDVKCWRCGPPRYTLDVKFAMSFFVFLWNNAFNVALGQMLIAMCCSLWFFKRGEFSRRQLLKTSLWNIFRYHLGSVAFGSFIIAVIQFIRYCLKYLEKQAGAQKNRVMVYVLRALQCCVWCFEKCVKFLNKNAYIQIALAGKNFCTSAKKAFFLILRNIIRFGIVATLGHIVHGIGIIAIIATNMVIGYLILRAMHEDTSPFMPLVAIFFVTVGIAKAYMNVFALAVDTSLQCFLAVEEAQAGHDCVPKVLQRFVSKKKDLPEDLEEDLRKPSVKQTE